MVTTGESDFTSNRGRDIPDLHNVKIGCGLIRFPILFPLR
jgi:hypothetical protein